MATVPDFGEISTEFRGMTLTCRAIAPGLSLHDLVCIYSDAIANASPSDVLSANPSKWPETRGVKAVAEAVLMAVYGQKIPANPEATLSSPIPDDPNTLKQETST